jgi:hypothetical protein
VATVTSRPIVRAGIAQFFGGTTYDDKAKAYRGNIPAALKAAGLSTVRAYRPKRLSDKDYVLGQATGRGMGAYLYVELPNDGEIRRALPAAGPGTGYILAGRKRITYSVVLHVFHLAHKAYAEDAEADVDNLLEEIKNRIRSDVSLGQICYAAGENNTGIRTRVYPSVTGEDEITGTYSTVTFDAEVEIIS